MSLALTQADLEALSQRCYRSPVEFCRIFLPDWFPTFMPWVHRGICALYTGRTEFLLDFGREVWRDGEGEWTLKGLEKILTNFLDEETKAPIFELVVHEDGTAEVLIHAKSSICIMMPRGSSKTTLVNALNLRALLYKDEDFFLYVSESGPHAARQLGTVKGELEGMDGIPNNELIALVFGEHQPPRQSPLKWSENFIETLKGVMVGAVGAGGQVRGFGKRGKRPGLIVFDDLQDEEAVESDTQRTKDSYWFFNAARPAKKKGGRDIIIGTLLHDEAILNKCVRHPEFTAVRFGAIDRQGDALMEWYMTLEEVEAKKLAAAQMGELAGFYREYMSEIRGEETQMFPESKLVYVTKGLDNFVAIAQACDPAISESAKAAMAAFAMVGIEKNGHKHVLDFHGQKGMDPFDIIEKIFEFYFRWQKHLPPENRKVGIEAIAFQRALIPIMRTFQVEKSRTYGTDAYFEILPIFHGKVAKATRIKGILKPLIWAGQLSFQQRWGSLHTQFTDFPGTLVDGPDVVAMATALLDPYVLLGLGADGEKQLVEDKAPPLHVVVGGNFRSAP